jgi:hypothetical protein
MMAHLPQNLCDPLRHCALDLETVISREHSRMVDRSLHAQACVCDQWIGHGEACFSTRVGHHCEHADYYHGAVSRGR